MRAASKLLAPCLALYLALCLAAPAAANGVSGAMENGPAWAVTLGGTLVAAPPRGDCTVYAACYDREGRFLDVKLFAPTGGPVSLSPEVSKVRLITADSRLTPLCQAVDLAPAAALTIALDRFESPTHLATCGLKGFVSPAQDVTLTIDGQAVEVNPLGGFAVAIPLEMGENTVLLTADDGQGHTASQRVTLHRVAERATKGCILPLSGVLTENPDFADCWLLEALDTDGTYLQAPVTASLKEAITAAPEDYVGRYWSVQRFAEEPVRRLAALEAPAQTASPLRYLAGGVVVTGQAAYLYDSYTRFCQAGPTEDGRWAGGVFDPEGFFTPGEGVQALVISADGLYADYVYLLRGA